MLGPTYGGWTHTGNRSSSVIPVVGRSTHGTLPSKVMPAGTHANRCKGIVFTSFLDVLESLKRRTAVNATLARIEARDFAEIIRHGGLVKSAWYPLDWYRALHAAAIEATGDRELPRAVGRIATRQDLTSGFAKFIVSVLTPQFLISASSKVFNRYYEVGEMRVLDSRAGHARAIWSGCAGFDHNIWADVLGGCEGGLEAGRAKEIRVRLVSGGQDGDESAEVEVKWK